MIRQAAFTGKMPLLKGALHCHTTRSDGKGTPEETLRLHKANGYDFVALTDHRNYNFKNFAPETGLIVVPGMEMDRSIPGQPGIHCFHTVVLGREKDKGNPYEQDQRFESGAVSGQEEFQPLLDEYHCNGQITLYCHPEWSGTPAREFEKMRGNFAMEIWNSGCVLENGMDTNAAWWDEILMQGQKLYGCATDDGHSMDQHCKGWVCVNAEKNVDSILEGLSTGAFYSSTGPEIKDFYIENGEATVVCSPCAEIVFRGGRFPCRREYDAEGKLTRATFRCPEGMQYLRVTVMDAQGRRAWTNPIFDFA